MGKTKFQESWKKTYDWVSKCPNNQFASKCLACNGKELNTQGGVAALSRHSGTDSHIKNYEGWKKQSMILVGANKEVLLSSPQNRGSPRVLTTEEQVLRAEIIRCLDIVRKNLPFSATSDDNKKYQQMFPDSVIAKTYSQAEDKTRYMIQFGIAPVITERILEDLKEKPFTFRFDETTTSQIKKQYDGYATFYSDKLKRVVTSYIGTLFVGKCTASDLLKDLEILTKKKELDITDIIALGMDGPSVNLLFFEMVCESFTASGKSIIDVGSCCLHIVSNAFGKGLDVLSEDGMDLDEFAINLYSFFKLSAKRIEQYFTSDIVSDLEPHRMIRHCETRWLGIQRVLMRIYEQFQNVKYYFLKIVPADKKTFNGKKGVNASARYQSIKDTINDVRTGVIISAVCFAAEEFKYFTVPLESKSPMITVLYSKMSQLLQNVMYMFLKEKVFIKNKKLLSIDKLKELNFENEENQRTTCQLGTKYRKELIKLEPLKQKQVDGLMKKFLIAMTKYLLENLPFENQILKDVQKLHPGYPLEDGSTPAIARLAAHLWRALGTKKAVKLFHCKENEDECGFVDLIKKELTSFRLASIEVDENPEPKKRSTPKPSYWRNCYDLMEIEQSKEKDCGINADGYWLKVMSTVDDDGFQKFKNLALMAICYLLMPHGNADPERGFSMNKKLLERYGSSLSGDCLESLRIAKDYLILLEDDMKIDRQLMSSCASSHSKYHEYLQRQQKKQRDEAAAKDAEREATAMKKKAEDLETKISLVNKKIDLPDALAEEGNKLLKACTKKMVQSVFLESQEKVELGLKRKKELTEKLNALKAKREKLG